MGEMPDVEMNGAAPDEHAQQPRQLPGRNVRLTIYREIVGVNPPPTLDGGIAKRPAENKGLYRRTVQAESKIRLQYYLCAAIFNTCFLLQIVVAAALTALGAANGPHLAVTVLGAVNTIIAGILTYLKGQGLPNRLRQYQSELRKVREYIEERERDFSRPDCQLNLDHEIAIIYRMYEAVRQNQEDNFPDTYHNFTTGNGTKPAATPGAQTPPMKHVDAIPDEKATANAPQVEVTATEVTPGLSDRASNRNSAHVPADANAHSSAKPPDVSGGYQTTGKPADLGYDGRPSSLDIKAAANEKSSAPYVGLRHVSGGIPSERRRSSIERLSNTQSRPTRAEPPAAARGRPNSMPSRRTSTDVPAAARERSSQRNSVYVPAERPMAQTGRSSNRNSGHDYMSIERSAALNPSGRTSNRNSPYILPERSTAQHDNLPNLDIDRTYAARPSAPIPSGQSSNRNSAYTPQGPPLAVDESIPGPANRDPPTEIDESQSEGSTSGNAGLAALSRRNSTTPIKQFFAQKHQKDSQTKYETEAAYNQK